MITVKMTCQERQGNDMEGISMECTDYHLLKAEDTEEGQHLALPIGGSPTLSIASRNEGRHSSNWRAVRFWEGWSNSGGFLSMV